MAETARVPRHTKPTKPAAAKEPKHNADRVRDEHVDCRTLGHGWQPNGVQRDGRDYLDGRVCTRCGTTKTVRINPRGEIEGTRYGYAEGYDVGHGGLEQSDRNRLRLRRIKAIVPGGLRVVR